MNKLILGRYFPGNSVIHTLDPRVKLISCVCFIFIVFLADNWETMLVAAVFTFWAMRLSAVGFRVYFQGVKPLIWLILFTVFLQILFRTGGHVYVDWGPVTISQYGLVNGAFIFFRFVTIIFISTVVTLTTKPIDLTDGIHSLLQPLTKLKIPVEELALMLSISLRFIPNLLDETQKVMDAQRARGTEFGEGSFLRQMKTLVPVFLPLYVSSLNRAEELANVMEVRGYQSGTKRSAFRQLRWRLRDSGCLVVMVLLTAILVLLRQG